MNIFAIELSHLEPEVIHILAYSLFDLLLTCLYAYIGTSKNDVQISGEENRRCNYY